MKWPGAVVADEPADHAPILLLHVGLIVLVVGTGSGEGPHRHLLLE